MLAMLEAKLPPPSPAVAAIARNAQYGVPGSFTATARRTAGTSRSSALTTVQLRPPNRAGANVYGIRSADPTRLGRETIQKSCSVVNR